VIGTVLQGLWLRPALTNLTTIGWRRIMDAGRPMSVSGPVSLAPQPPEPFLLPRPVGVLPAGRVRGSQRECRSYHCTHARNNLQRGDGQLNCGDHELRHLTMKQSYQVRGKFFHRGPPGREDSEVS
jgi:hypothetical protein